MAESLDIAVRADFEDSLRILLFRPSILHVLDAALAAPHRSISVITGARKAAVEAQGRDCPGIGYFETWDGFLSGRDGTVLVLAGDAPVLSADSVREMLERHQAGAAAFTFDPDSGAYAFETDVFQGSGDLADAMRSADAKGLRVQRFRLANPAEGIRVRDSYLLWQAESALRERVNHGLMLSGVTLRDPSSSCIDPRCRIAPGVEIEPGVILADSALEAGVRVQADCRIIGAQIGAGSVVRQGSSIEASRIGRDCLIGPYARIRGASRIEDRARVGNFVEIKNSTLGADTRAAHLSYIGDALVGRNVNIGCGFITCNSGKGPTKARTVIEDDVFVGSASQAVAPVRLGAGSFIATGTTITEDVPPEAFVISRGRQVTKPGYARKYAKRPSTLPSQG